ncbi:hypothetical protein [Fonticella tunisiensis]|uniref:Uncharacterized protein n=1 Tax=Fonticella tunisiensis TaxID=1096341 RepID=A0A4R7KAS7_9CLOT|nr:hypothetical protein [Fonticella tunisiensis]TDT51992.1 hypothetical protein EDD71_11523 [Fonticella tunisiensis]
MDSFHCDSDLSLLTKDKVAARLDILRQHKGIGVYMTLCDGLGITPAYKKVTMFKQIHDSIYGSVLVLFGKTAFGYFACIPDFEAGCHLSHLKDTFWNIEQLVRIIDEVTGITIAEALRAVADYIGPKAHKKD